MKVSYRKAEVAIPIFVKGYTLAMAENVPEDPYYLLIIISQMKHDVNALIKQIRVCGTYAGLKAAKAAMHNPILDTGGEQELFSEYDVDERYYEPERETDIRSYDSFEEVKKAALAVLLNEEDGIMKDSFSEYSEAGPGERDYGYAKDVVVHAVAENGENYLVRVVKTEGFESVKEAHAAGKKD